VSNPGPRFEVDAGTIIFSEDSLLFGHKNISLKRRFYNELETGTLSVPVVLKISLKIKLQSLVAIPITLFREREKSLKRVFSR
jgi:hypothetical protein